jgi:predicted phosphodiesterase
VDKIAVISDVHGNITAFDAVIADIRARGIEQIYNLGDVVGKGPCPGAAIDRSREVCQVVVRGNWDDWILNEREMIAATWQYDQIGAARRAYLKELPDVHDFWLSGRRVRLYHASQKGIYHRVRAWAPYETHQAMFENTNFTGFGNPAPDIVGYGDIHNAYMHSLDQKVLFNVGSVGNPLDLPMASYAILSGTMNSETPAPFCVDFVRVVYDIEAEVELAYRCGVPEADAYAVELRTCVYRGRPKASD